MKFLCPVFEPRMIEFNKDMSRKSDRYFYTQSTARLLLVCFFKSVLVDHILFHIVVSTLFTVCLLDSFWPRYFTNWPEYSVGTLAFTLSCVYSIIRHMLTMTGLNLCFDDSSSSQQTLIGSPPYLFLLLIWQNQLWSDFIPARFFFMLFFFSLSNAWTNFVIVI